MSDHDQAEMDALEEAEAESVRNAFRMLGWATAAMLIAGLSSLGDVQHVEVTANG